MVNPECEFRMMSYPIKLIGYMSISATILRYIDGSGIQRVCGGSDLKASQHYPKLLGLAVGELFHGRREWVKQRMEETR